MAYGWLDIIVAIAAALMAALLFSGLFKRRRLAFFLLTLSVTALAWMIAFFFITPYYKITGFQRHLQAQPVFSVLKQEDPQLFNTFMQAAIPLALQQQDPQQVTLAATKLAQRAFRQSLSKAPDASITAYLSVTLNFYKKLLSIEPKRVLMYGFPDQFGQNQVDALDTTAYAPELAQVYKARAEVIIDAVKTPQTAPELFEIEHLHNLIWSKLAAKYGKDQVELTLAQPTSSKLDPATGAKILLDYYGAVLALGPANAGKLMRYLAQSLKA